ncbi:hypothetical protein [Sporosarcina sp. FA15]|uniref:hypothetical protein n=1 Tax=Sporosarcina sp. FA15 TaxID=3413031 RepID=UPI003F6583FD
MKWISPKKVENVTGKGKGASSNNGEAIDTIDADKDVNIDNFDFGKFLKKHKDDPPEEMKNHHAHHILFKRGNGKAKQELVKEGQEILREYDIDPIYGLENLTWAPNIKGQHDITPLRNVVDKIKEVENNGGDRDDIVQILERLGRIAAQRR